MNYGKETLVIHPSVSYLQVTVCNIPVLPVIVECVSCTVLSSPHRISYTTPTVLSGQCDQCDDQAQVMTLMSSPRHMSIHWCLQNVYSGNNIKS